MEVTSGAGTAEALGYVRIWIRGMYECMYVWSALRAEYGGGGRKGRRGRRVEDLPLEKSRDGDGEEGEGLHFGLCW